jgi:hypothetical protein
MKKTFLFPDGEEHSSSLAAESTPLEFASDYCFVIVAINSDLVGGTPKFSLEASVDNVNWYNYSTESTDVPTTDFASGDCIQWAFMRIKHIPNSASEGATKYMINIKKK